MTVTTALGAIAPSAVVAQAPVPAITLGSAVDTGAAPVRDIVRTVMAYYRLPSPGRTPTTLWAAEDQAVRPNLYDLAAESLYESGFPATIVGVVPVHPDSSEWVVRTLFAAADSASLAIEPLALQRLHVRRAPPASGAPYGWQLYRRLRALTHDWPVHVVGGITYHVAPDVTFDHERARAAARFVDSTAARLGVPPPDRIAYYLTASGEACERLRGIDWIMSASAWTGRAFPDERLICAGNPTLGEAYYHELAHVILAPLSPLERQHRLVGEGAATWLGGGYRGPLASYYQLLREYQRAHPAISFEESLRRFDADNAYYATGALVAQAVVERGGVPALRRLMATGATTDSLLSALPDLLGVQRARLDAWWRREAARRALRSSAAITTPATTP